MILRFSAFLLLLTTLTGRAQTTANNDTAAAISDDRMRELLGRMGFEFTENSSGDATAFTFPLNGRVVRLLNRVGSIELSACFERGADLLKENQWNQEHFATGAYLDEQGCSALRAQARFSVGVTNRMIEEWLSQFCTDVAIFDRFVALAPPSAVAPSAPAATSPIGTMAWSHRGPETKQTSPRPGRAASAPGILQINPKASLRYDPAQWNPEISHDDGQFVFAHSSGAGHALVIAEPIAMPLGSIEDVALANAQSVDPHAKIVFRNRRRVGGVVLSFLKIEAEVDTVPMVYCGYYYGGENGTVQLVTYTEKARFPEYEKVFMDFLNGFVVSK